MQLWEGADQLHDVQHNVASTEQRGGCAWTVRREAETKPSCPTIDPYAVLSSLLYLAAGTLAGVAFYESEFGKEHMEREAMGGPPAKLFGR